MRCFRHFYSLFVFLHSSIWVSYNRSARISKKNYVAFILTILVVMPTGMLAQNTAVDFEENGELQQRLDYLWQRLGILPPPSGARAFALQQMNLVSTFDAASGSTVNGITATAVSGWSAIGPQPTGGSGFTALTSGRVAGLAVDPIDSRIVYLAAAEGGVWKTADGGTTWVPLTDQNSSLAIGSITIDPNNRSIIYAGTGEANFSDSYYGAGILKSIDGGAHWQELGTNTFRGAHIGAISVQPGNGNVILAAVYYFSGPVLFPPPPSGIYRSIDGGQNWTKVLSGNISSVTFANSSTAFAGVESSGIYHSIDGGATWTPANGIPGVSINTENTFRVEFGIARSTTSSGSLITLYASLAGSAGVLSGFYRSTDSANTWTRLITPDYCNNQCWYDNVVAVNPQNPDVVFVGGSGFLSAVLNGQSTWVMRSVDGGQTWIPASSGTHPDQHAMAFSSDGTLLYLGNDGGVFSTTNILSGNVVWTNLNQTLNITQFYTDFAIDPNDVNRAYGGTQDNGTQRYSGSLLWKTVACGDGGSTVVTSTAVYAACQDVQITKSTANDFFIGITNEVAVDNKRGAFIPPMIGNPGNPDQVFFGTYRVWRTNNGGSSWQPISGDIGTFHYPDGSGGTGIITQMASAPNNPDVLYAATSNGRIWRAFNAASVVVNGQANFTDVTGSGLDVLHFQGRSLYEYTNAIGVNPNDQNIVYIGLAGFNHGHIFKSTTGGGTPWIDLSGNLPDIPVNDIAVDPNLPTVLYIATDIGVFRGIDTGVTANWQILSQGLPRVAVFGLKLHRASRILRAATHGRGMWDLSVPIPPARRRAVAHPGSGTTGHAITTTVADSTAEIPDHYELVSGQMPPGLSFTFANGQISGTPTPPPTIYDFTVAAAYPDGQRVFQEIAMPICQATTSGPTPIANIPVNTFYFIGTIPGGNPPGVFRYDIVYGSLPPGMTLDANTGAVSGAPTVPGTYQYKIGTTRVPGLFVPACPAGTSTDAFYQVTVSCSIQCQAQYEGYNDGVDTDNVWGWAWDKSQPNTSTQVDIYDSMADSVPAGTTLLGRVNANLFRQDLADAGKGNGNHAFVFQVPDALKDGNTHRIHVTFAGTLQELTWSPRILAASSGRFVGAHNNNGCDQIDGYALDNWQSNNPIDVDIFDNGQFLATVVANFDSNTVPATSGHGAHGFLYFTPDRLKDGTNHLITINFKLSGLPLSATNRTLNCPAATPASNPSWEGWLDNATCDRVDGWAWDATRPNSPIDVAMFADGVRVATLTANQFGQDLLNAGKGNGVHRYFHYLPDFLKDNAPHNITMQIVGQNTSLPISSGITNGVVSCAALPPPTRPPLHPIANTSTGANTTASIGPASGTTPGVDVMFSSVSVEGLTSFVPIDPSNLPELPTGYGYPHATITPMAFDISTTASYSGPLFVTFTILSETDPAEFASLRILHLENGAWQDRTYFVSNMAGHQVIALTNSLSPFVIARTLQNTTPANIAVNSTWNSIYGENVVFTAVVSSSGSVPTGTVTFTDGGQFLATAALDSQGQASMSTRSLSAGTHQLSVSYSGNGVFSPGVAQFVQVVSPALLSVMPDSASRAYGDANPSFSGVVSGLQNGDNITASYFSSAAAATPVGAYSIAASLSDPGGKLGNYTLSQGTGTLSIQPAALQVTTNNKTRIYGDANPVLDGTITGIRNADNIQVQYSTTATTASGVGTYPITATLSDPNGRLGNYTVSVQNGTLTITPAALQVTANNKTRMYGDSNPPLDGTLTGVRNGDFITAQYATTATTQSLLGNYPITIMLTDANGRELSANGRLGNYQVTLQNGTLTITRSNTALAAPTLTPPAGTYPPGTSITITDATSSAAAIHYTTDGTTPTAASPLYTAPIVVNANVFIKAMATQPEYLDSSVSSAFFSTRISISASPSPQQLLGCASASYAVTVPAQTGVTGTLTLSVSGLPAGATAGFSPATLTNSGSSTLTVNTSTTTPAGTYPLTSTVSNATLSGSTNVSLVVQDFNVATTAASQTVTAGGIASYSLSGSVVNGFAGTVTLTLSGLPTGATATFTPALFTGAGNSTLNVTTSTSTPPGTYTLTATGTSGCRTHTLPLTLIVNAPPPTGPNISSLSVIAGSVGTAVTINGVNFGATQGTSTVTFSGIAAQPTAWSATSVAVIVPRGAKTGNVVVTAGGQASNGLAFTVQDDAVHIFGTNCATCGWQITDFTIQASPLYGYTIRSGDILYFYESQNSTSVAGIEVCFPSGEGVACADNGLTVDQDNKPVHADTITGVTHFRRVDLSPNAGQILSQISFHSHGTTKAGRWDVYFSNVEIVSTDGSVHSIFVTGATPGLFKSSSFGVTGTGSTIEHNHVW